MCSKVRYDTVYIYIYTHKRGSGICRRPPAAAPRAGAEDRENELCVCVCIYIYIYTYTYTVLYYSML